ncbi:hypothetical protein BVRB_007540 [Beta vulgaris subsp. vulgaris]|uniref:Uncharacterized protein n=2 Tax=Beta vulgaris subsp. vulgaris TaxID=3555 RepID=A0A0J8B336_BETVV|nr:hypothetical protein BVRB_007540 [Beta vulgaris subsp. vulgaris]
MFAEGVPLNLPSSTSALNGPKRTGKCNLRKSLAWDSAFFTNAGVLDPEELSSIIEGAETSVKQNQSLPGIQEELSKSTDSVSTFQSDNLTLESLEADLFSDIRASIQRCSKSSATGMSPGSKVHGEEESTNACSTKIVEPSRKMAKPKSASNKLMSGVQRPVRTLKPVSVSKQETKPPVSRSREPSSLLPRPLNKAAGEPNLKVAATPKRMSVGAGRVKVDAIAAESVKVKGSSLPEAPRQVNSRKPLPKAPASSKIPAPSSVLNRTTTRSSRSSCDSSSSSASENVRKSHLGAIKGMMVKNVNVACGSKIRTSSKLIEKARSQNKDSRLSASLKSASDLSPSISPASSISEWSTESSSSTATVNQKHFGVNPYPPSSQDVTVDSNITRTLRNLSSDRALSEHDNKVPQIFSQSAKQTPSTGSVVSNTRSGSVSSQLVKQQPSTGSVVSNNRPDSAKPSGLRMPSPNIGFFDGVKAGARTPSSSRSRSTLPSSLPRSAAGTFSPSGTSNKTKLATGASRLTAAGGAGRAKLKQQTDTNLKTAACLLDQFVDLQTPSVAKHIDNNSKTSSEFLRSTPPKSALERNKVIPEASDLRNLVPDCGLVYEDKLTSDLVTVDSVETSSELLTSISPKSAVGAINDIPEASVPGKHVSDSWQVGKYNFACDLLTVTTEDGPKPDSQNFEADLKSCVQDNLVDLENPTSKLPESNLSKSVLEIDSEVAKATDGGKQVLELALKAKDDIVASEDEASPQGKLLITLDLEKISTNELKADSQSINPNVPPTAQLQGCSADLQGASQAKNTDIGSGSSSVLSNGTSCMPAFKPNSEVHDGEKDALPDFGSVVEDDLIAPETEKILHSANHLVAVVSEDGSNILDRIDCVKTECASPHSTTEQSNRSNGSISYNLISSHQVDEADNLDFVGHHTQQDDSEIMGHSATDENQCLESVVVESEEDAFKLISEVDDEEKHTLPDFVSVVEDGLVAPETEKIFHSANDLVDVTSEDGSEILDRADCVKIESASPRFNMEQSNRSNSSTFYNLIPSQQVDEADNLDFVGHHTQQDEGESMGDNAIDENQCLETVLVEFKEDALKPISEVDDGEKHTLPNFGSVVADDLIAPETEKILHSATDLVAVASEDGSNILDGTTDWIKIECARPHSSMEQSSRSNSCTFYNFTPSQEVDEDDNLDCVGHQAQQDDSETMGHSATDENQCLVTVPVEFKEDAYDEIQLEGFSSNMDSRDNKVEMPEKLDRNLQSDSMLFDKVTSGFSSFMEPCDHKENESAQLASLISCSPLPSLEVGYAARTPFKIKNTVPNLVELSNPATGSATEAFLKVDVVPSLENSQKETY